MLLASVVSDSLWPRWTGAHQAHLSMGFPGKNAGVGCRFLLQGIQIQGLNPCLLHLLCWQADSLLLLAPPGKPFKCILMLNFFRCSLGKPKTPPSFLDLTTTGKSCTFCQTGLWAWVPACSCLLFLLRFCWLSGCEHSLWLPCTLANITVTRTISWSPELSATLKSFYEGGQVHAREPFLCCS